MAAVASKIPGGAVSPPAVNRKSAIHRRFQHGVCAFPNSSGNSFPPVKLRCINHGLPSSDLFGRGVALAPSGGVGRAISSNAQMSIGLKRANKWWEKGLQPNMKEVTSAHDLVESLLNSGDKLVVVDFFSPGCGGCKALHPKICQLAEMNPDVQFLQVNYEEHKSMCHSLNVHVLPLFRFYRGDKGRVCSFSCTNATIKKFKDALLKYGSEHCSEGPAKGLEEKELLALSNNRDLSFEFTPKQEPLPLPSPEEVIAVGAKPSFHSPEFQFPLTVPRLLDASQKINQVAPSK
ncbi:hypothetical protein DM860_010679 [Cuscuta australis]|uniref:Thioredoxin domain-containing protein n=1 Tax=Cuscuta australis TaxID=267555 RepID=A0A328E680_9ASTE|nr:hypothetical protein DM860_010679 [Cuscuta australis]